MSPEDFSKRMNDAEQLADGMRQMSEILTGQVRVLQSEGWTEPQARDLVVAVFVANAKGPQS